MSKFVYGEGANEVAHPLFALKYSERDKNKGSVLYMPSFGSPQTHISQKMVKNGQKWSNSMGERGIRRTLTHNSWLDRHKIL